MRVFAHYLNYSLLQDGRHVALLQLLVMDRGFNTYK